MISVETYWLDPPPEPSANLKKWVGKIQAGWRPNKRISSMGYYAKAEFFGVYIWEYFHVIYPMLNGREV